MSEGGVILLVVFGTSSDDLYRHELLTRYAQLSIALFALPFQLCKVGLLQRPRDEDDEKKATDMLHS